MTAKKVADITPAKREIQVRMPKFRDAANFISALAAGNPADMMDALDGGFNSAAFVLAIRSSLRSPLAREEMLTVIGDLWVYDVPDAEVKTPPEDWEYDPDPELVESGQAISRETQWKALSAKTRRRIIKRLMLEDMEIDVIGQFIESFKELPYIKDFLESQRRKQEEEAGKSATQSQNDTVGQTG